MRQLPYQFFLIFIFCQSFSAFAQNIPVSFPMLNDYLRREQVMGNLDTDFSFNYRPILTEKAFPEFSNPFLLDSAGGYTDKQPGFLPDKKALKISLLPIQKTTVFNASHPYGWGNGAMIPARGLQTLVSAGIHIKSGPLSIQLYPQFHYAQNLPFEEYAPDAPRDFFLAMRRDNLGTELPVRHGIKSITKFLSGNSNVMLNFGAFSAGVSTENIWWGPGQFHSLLLSDNAEGFLHATLKTSKPAKTFLGNFEGQFFMGRLERFGGPHFSDSAFTDILPIKEEDNWRYFTGLSFSYAPKWIKGLSVGFSRTFQVYREDMRDNLRAWFPVFDPLPKEGLGLIENIELREDQHVAVFARFVLPKAQTEFYLEYIRNDHALNWRDFILNPEQSRGYLMGFNKIFSIPSGQNFMIRAEMNHTQIPLNNIIRARGEGVGIYYNGSVRQGLTNKGQTLGSGAGQSGNHYIFELSHFEGFNRYGIHLGRHAREQNFYYNAIYRGVELLPWVDLIGGVFAERKIKNLLLEVHLKGIKSKNYNWDLDRTMMNIDGFLYGRDRGNFHTMLKVAYIL